MLPAWDPQLLPAGQAADALDLYAFSGHMEGWRTPKLLRNLTNSAAKFVYRVPATAQAFATVYLVFTAGFAYGTTITVGQHSYVFRPVGSNNPYEIYGQATLLANVTALLDAITNDSGAQTNMGITYGDGTEANPDVGVQSYIGYAPLGSGSGSAAYVPFIALQAPVVGVANNGVACNVSGAPSIFVLSDLASLSHTATSFTGGTNPTLDTTISAASSWLEFVDPDTNVVRSQVLNDQFQRYYFASPSQAPQYNTAARIAANQPAFLLGINPPSIAPTVLPAGGNNLQSFPTYGSAHGGSGALALGANSMWLVPITPTANGTLQSVSHTPATTDATQQFMAVVYSDNGTATGGGSPTTPFTLIAAGAIQTGVIAATPAVSPLLNPIGLSTGISYWIGVMLLNPAQLYQANPATPAVALANSGGVAFSNGAPFNVPTMTSASVTTNPSIWATLQTSDVQEARAYVYTWVSAYQEESAPSPFTIGNGFTDATWQVQVSPPPVTDMGTERNLAFTRIYRTVTGSSGSTVFFWIADIPITQTGYLDTTTDAVAATHIQLPSTTYFPPPANLQGLMNLPNGMVVGFIGNQIWYCAPFLPHAWPPGQVFNTDYPIVGMGWTNDALVVCTKANPFVLVGTNPNTVSVTKCQSPDPCLSRGSILSTDTGVFYMSPNGLIQVTNLAQATNVTELWITREKWAQLTPQKYGRVAPVSGCYLCYGSTSTPNVATTTQGFALELNQDNTSFTIWPQPGGHRVGFTRLSAPNGYNVDNLEIDPWSGTVMLVQNGQVWYFDFTDPAPTMQPYSYTSKVYQQNTKKSYSAMRMFFTTPPNTPALSAEPNTSPETDPSWQTLSANQWAVVLVYADVDDGTGQGNMQLVCAREVRKSGELLRILGGFKAERWQFKVMGRVVVSNLQVATSVKELANV